MSNWRSSGSAIRRRAGAPSNHFDSVGMRGRVNLPTPEEALAGMAAVGSPRVPMGNSVITDVVNVSGAPLKGTLMPRKNTQAGQVPPASPGLPANRQNVPQERLGAQYYVSATVPAPVLAEASATQANGRIVTSAVQREGNFGDAASNSYA